MTQLTHLAPDLIRLIAPNASPMTYTGTCTYLLGRSQIAVIDPGPDDPGHIAAIQAALPLGAQITHIFVTHAHLDHSPGARSLSAATGAPVLAYGRATAGRRAIMETLAAEGGTGGGEGVDWDFTPDVALADGAITRTEDWTLTAHWTPGHMANHMCFATPEVMFCGDHVMAWSTSLISPPDGDLAAFMASCTRLRSLPARPYYPGHGDPIMDPHARLDWLVQHRTDRSAQIKAALCAGPQPIPALTRRIYHDLAPHLWPMAERNVLAHLIELVETGHATAHPQLSATAQYTCP